MASSASFEAWDAGEGDLRQCLARDPFGLPSGLPIPAFTPAIPVFTPAIPVFTSRRSRCSRPGDPGVHALARSAHWLELAPDPATEQAVAEVGIRCLSTVVAW
jgi:hypothetical protein